MKGRQNDHDDDWSSVHENLLRQEQIKGRGARAAVNAHERIPRARCKRFHRHEPIHSGWKLHLIQTNHRSHLEVRNQRSQRERVEWQHALCLNLGRARHTVVNQVAQGCARGHKYQTRDGGVCAL